MSSRGRRSVSTSWPARATIAGALPLQTATLFDGQTANPLNAVNHNPLMRAKLINLERWVTAGEEPPPSAFPRLANGTAVSPNEVVAAFSAVPGVAVPNVEHLQTLGGGSRAGTARGALATSRPSSASGTPATSRPWTPT